MVAIQEIHDFCLLKASAWEHFFFWAALSHNFRPALTEKTPRSTLENQYRERTRIPYCFQISHAQKVTLFTDKKWLGKGSFLIQAGALLFSSSFQFLQSRSHPSRKLSGTCAFLDKSTYEGIFLLLVKKIKILWKHSFFLGIPSKVLFYKVRYQDPSTQVIFLKKSFFFVKKIRLKSMQESCIQSWERTQYSAFA